LLSYSERHLLGHKGKKSPGCNQQPQIGAFGIHSRPTDAAKGDLRCRSASSSMRCRVWWVMTFHARAWRRSSSMVCQWRIFRASPPQMIQT